MLKMTNLFDIFMVLFGVIFGFSLVFVILSFCSPKFRGKMMSKNIKSMKHMLNYSKDDLEEIGKMAGDTSINIEKGVLDRNEDKIRHIVNTEADIEKDAIEVKAKALKDGLTGNKNYCKHCGTLIDKDSKYCKQCGKEQ